MQVAHHVGVEQAHADDQQQHAALAERAGEDGLEIAVERPDQPADAALR